MRECTFVHDRIRRFSQRGYGGFFRITSHNRGLRKIVQDKAQGSGREGAYFVYATERTGSCNAVLGNFSASIAQSRTEKNLSEQGVRFCE